MRANLWVYLGGFHWLRPLYKSEFVIQTVQLGADHRAAEAGERLADEGCGTFSVCHVTIQVEIADRTFCAVISD